MHLHDFNSYKQQQKKFTMTTCYDYTFASCLSKTNIDCILVGDSAAMVMHGHPNTTHATIEMMRLHTQAVARGAANKFIVGDLPFLSYRKSLTETLDAVSQLITAGAHAIKLEGADGNLDIITHLVTSGIPVMGHLGLTPQHIHQLGGFKIQGRGETGAILLAQSKALEQAGCFALVLECVPSTVAQNITQAISIPTIGIGAGIDTDGQVLVLQDMLGLTPNFKPKFLKQFMAGESAVIQALNNFHHEVITQQFPTQAQCYDG